MRAPSRVCFVISPIGAPESPERLHADRLLSELVDPVASSLGYEVLRADHMSTPGLITHDIVYQLFNAEMVVADLSFGNPNVFYELAVRHLASRPVVPVISRDDHIPFDVAAVRCVVFDPAFPTEQAGDREALHRQMREAAEAGVGAPNPISTALDPWKLRLPNDGVARYVFEVITSWYQEMRILLGFRAHAPFSCRVCHDMADAMARVHNVLHDTSRQMWMPSPDQGLEYARHTFMSGRGLKSPEDYWPKPAED